MSTAKGGCYDWVNSVRRLKGCRQSHHGWIHLSTTHERGHGPLKLRKLSAAPNHGSGRCPYTLNHGNRQPCDRVTHRATRSTEPEMLPAQVAGQLCLINLEHNPDSRSKTQESSAPEWLLHYRSTLLPLGQFCLDLKRLASRSISVLISSSARRLMNMCSISSN